MLSDFFAEPDFLALLRFWEAGRGNGGRALPEWDGDVSRVPAQLRPNIIVSERRPEPVYRYIGAECARRFGEDVLNKRVYDEVLRGEHARYIRSLSDEMIARRAPIFSAGIYRPDESAEMIMTARLFVPFTHRGSADPCVILALQLFRGPRVALARLGAAGFVDETQRQMIAAVPELCVRLKEARRYHLLARNLHQEALARDMAAIARDLTGGALVPLPCYRSSA